MRARLAGALAGALGLIAAAAHAAPASCDRRCLLQVLTQYTEALADNAPGEASTAPTVRVTANGAVVKLGETEVWGGPRRLPYRKAFVDPVSGAAFFYGMVTTPLPRTQPGATAPTPPADFRWWFYVVRLKVEQQKITEIEQIYYRPESGGFGANPRSETLTLPDRIWDAVLPVSEQSSRSELFHIADLYFDAVSHLIDYHQVPWHPECQRIELGIFTVNGPSSAGSCGGEFQTPSMKWNVVNRRFYLADPERGVVIAVGNFTTPPEYPSNNGSVVMEIFKVQDGLIRHIEAFFKGNGQLHSGWGEGPGS
jgi:hypothetical protein